LPIKYVPTISSSHPSSFQSSMHSPRLRIAIWFVSYPSMFNTSTHCPAPFSGGGIGGLTCAIALSRNPDLQVDVYEAAPAFAEVGAGVGIWPRPWKVLESLGLGPDLLAATEIKPKKGPGMPSAPRWCTLTHCPSPNFLLEEKRSRTRTPLLHSSCRRSVPPASSL
jgi:hypothetical protein